MGNTACSRQCCLRRAQMAEKTFRERLARVVDFVGGQLELARRSGIAVRSIGTYLRGGEPRNYAVIKALADGGGVRHEWLGKGEGEMQAQTQPAAEPPSSYGAVNVQLM